MATSDFDKKYSEYCHLFSSSAFEGNKAVYRAEQIIKFLEFMIELSEKEKKEYNSQIFKAKHSIKTSDSLVGAVKKKIEDSKKAKKYQTLSDDTSRKLRIYRNGVKGIEFLKEKANPNNFAKEMEEVKVFSDFIIFESIINMHNLSFKSDINKTLKSVSSRFCDLNKKFTDNYIIQISNAKEGALAAFSEAFDSIPVSLTDTIVELKNATEKNFYSLLGTTSVEAKALDDLDKEIKDKIKNESDIYSPDAIKRYVIVSKVYELINRIYNNFRGLSNLNSDNIGGLGKDCTVLWRSFRSELSKAKEDYLASKPNVDFERQKEQMNIRKKAVNERLTLLAKVSREFDLWEKSLSAEQKKEYIDLLDYKERNAVFLEAELGADKIIGPLDPKTKDYGEDTAKLKRRNDYIDKYVYKHLLLWGYNKSMLKQIEENEESLLDGATKQISA